MLVACGVHDPVTLPEYHEEMASLIPRARYAPVEYAGPMALMEQPAAINALLRY